MKKLVLPLLLFITSIAITALSWRYLSGGGADGGVGILAGKPPTAPGWLPRLLRVHIGAGMLSLFAGAGLALTVRWRWRFRRLHRALGRGYGLAVVVSGGAGLLVSPFAIGGPAAALGLGCLALAWLYATGRAVLLAVRGDLAGHRRLAVYSLALTFSALTFRLLLLPALLGWPFLVVYRVACWASWLLHLAVARCYLAGRPRPAPPVVVRNAVGLLLLLVTPAAAAAQAPGYDITVVVEDVRVGSGPVQVCLVADSAQFLRRCFRAAGVPATAPRLLRTFTGLPAGTYALTLYQDLNANGRLDRNGLFGLPSEPYGFSNNPRVWFGPPSFAKCAFVLSGDRKVRIRM